MATKLLPVTLLLSELLPTATLDEPVVLENSD